MGLFRKIKSLLGMGPAEEPEPGVSVERERSDAGPETAADTTSDTADVDPGTTDAGPESTDSATEPADPDSEPTGTGAAEAGADPAADRSDAATNSVENIKGIGPAYADRLGDAGVGTVGELADADPEALAEETDLSAKRVGNWIEQARARI